MQNCCTSTHHKLLDTWNQKGSLQTSDYDPFNSLVWPKFPAVKENCCGDSNNYARVITSWTRGGNVTPDNSDLNATFAVAPTKVVHKEKFCCNANSSYARSTQTWKLQNLYTSN